MKQGTILTPRLSIRKTPIHLAVVSMLLAATSSAEVQQIRFSGAEETSISALSGDGRVAVGSYSNSSVYGGRAFRWTEKEGTQALGVLTHTGSGNDRFSSAAGVSYDGSVVVGQSGRWYKDANLNAEVWTDGKAFRWTAAGGMQSLGTLLGAAANAQSGARGVSHDGAVIAGGAFNAANAMEAFRWTAQSGMVGLGILPGHSRSEAFAVSGDGKVIVGDTYNLNNPDGASEAFRWTAQTGMVVLGDLPGGRRESTTWATNQDGSVVVGLGHSANGEEAFRWTQAGGMVGLGDLSGGGFASEAFALNADGSVVVGQGTTARGLEAFRWTEQDKMHLLTDWLTKNGVKVAQGLVLERATGISADGSVVAGTTRIGGLEEGFIARVSAVGSGVLMQSTVGKTLAVAQMAGQDALRSGATMVHGAHSRPLARRVAPTEKAFWLAGDWGRDDHGNRHGQAGLAEVGGGVHLGPTQLNLALGQAWSRQEQSMDSRTAHDGTYLQGDWLLPIGGNWWGVLGAYGMWGDADMTRGYSNAGIIDHSKGKTDVNSWGVRARLEWDRGVSFANTFVSPYVDASYGRARMDGYMR